MLHALVLAFTSGSALPQDCDYAGCVRPFLEHHCFGCHGAERQKGGLDLEELASEEEALGDLELFLDVRERLREGIMPPADEPRPDPAELERVVGWIDGALASEAAAHLHDPGRVRLRRLSRYEYANTVRDLFGFDCDPRELLPPDEVAHGFENIGDVQSFSPLLVEKYLAAAERVSDWVVEGLRGSRSRKVEAAAITTREKDYPLNGGARWLYSEGTAEARFELSRAGLYRVTVAAGAQQAGGEPARIALRAGGRELGRYPVEADFPTLETRSFALPLEAGPCLVEAAFINDYYKPPEEGRAAEDRNLAVASIELTGPLEGVRLAGVLADALAPGWQRKAGFEPALGRLVERVWRRPAARSEVARLAALEGAGAEPADRLGRALVALLVSPHFLLRVETDPEEAGGAVHPLAPYELATRLSYFLWSSTPDARLLELARSGELSDEAVLRSECARLLGDARASALIEGFFVPWLGLRRLDESAPDPTRFPDFDPELRRSMRSETELFLESILYEDRPVSQLLLADYTFADERLAKHYGLVGALGDRMRRLALDPAHRAGLLTQASVLTLTSNPTRTSPVKRGKWILETLLGTPPKPPPPGVGVLAESREAEEAQSMRERLALHRADPECAACHAALDPLGLVLEGFDATGRERSSDSGHPLELAVELPDGRSIAGPRALAEALLEGGRFERALLERLLVYALGRELTRLDRATVDHLLERYRSGPPTLRALLTEVALEPAFRTRRR